VDSTNERAVSFYGSIFSNILLPNEILLNAAPAIHVEMSEKNGKGTGDGTIAITNLRVIHIYSAAIFKSPGFAFNRSDISSSSKNWIVLPGSSNLKFTGNSNGAAWTHNFYCSKDFCKEVTGDF
jgi:hypothetical protein